MGSIFKNISQESFDKMSTIEKAALYLMDRREKIGNPEILSKGINIVINRINDRFGGDNSSSISLYDFIKAYMEEYRSFKKEYDELGRLDLGKKMGISYRDYVDDSKHDYRFLSFALLDDLSGPYWTDPVAPSFKISVPGKKYEYHRFMIVEKNGIVSPCFSDYKNNPVPVTTTDVDSETLREYLDLFAKHHQLCEIARRDHQNRNISLEDEELDIYMDISIDVKNFLLNGLSSVDVEFEGSVGELEGEYNGTYSVRISLDLNDNLSSNIHLNGHLVGEYLPESIGKKILKSIVIDRKYLKGYTGSSSIQEKEKKKNRDKKD